MTEQTHRLTASSLLWLNSILTPTFQRGIGSLYEQNVQISEFIFCSIPAVLHTQRAEIILDISLHLVSFHRIQARVLFSVLLYFVQRSYTHSLIINRFWDPEQKESYPCTTGLELNMEA